MLNEFPIFDYEDIQLIPNKCVIKSRAEADTSVTLGNHTFKLPVVPANMQTILDENVAEQLAKGGYFYIMHRFDEAGRIPFIKRMHDQGLIASISVGVKDYEYDFVRQLKADAPEYITIDIAKSIRFGASMIMIGSLFAGHIESPGKTIEVDGEQFKEYYGSASQYQKGAYKNVEGKRILLPAKGHLQDTLTEMEQDLQSAISYAGGRQVADLKHVDYVIVKNSIWNGDASH